MTSTFFGVRCDVCSINMDLSGIHADIRRQVVLVFEE